MSKLRRRSKKETFHYFDLTLDVNKAKQIVSKKKRTIKLIDVPRLFSSIDWSLRRINPHHAKVSNLRKPLIFAIGRGSRHQSYSLLVDGHHRLYRAYHEGIERLPAFFLSLRETRACVLEGKKANISYSYESRDPLQPRR